MVLNSIDAGNVCVIWAGLLRYIVTITDTVMVCGEDVLLVHELPDWGTSDCRYWHKETFGLSVDKKCFNNQMPIWILKLFLLVAPAPAVLLQPGDKGQNSQTLFSAKKILQRLSNMANMRLYRLEKLWTYNLSQQVFMCSKDQTLGCF